MFKAIIKPQNCIEKKRGYTLVELIVSFALIGIFMVTAGMVLANAYKVHTEISNLSKAQTVSDMILESISSELSSAKAYPLPAPDSGKVFDISEPGQVRFVNAQGIPTTLSVKYDDNDKEKGGYLQVIYPEADVETDGTAEADFYFGKNTYLRNKITDLKFEKLEDNKNVITTTLTIKNQITGFTFTSKKTIQIYNVNGTNIN
ncbi:type II secretion system protein [Ohessyouella blattaphilus]|uniref:Prepilin-type N-terminal cleavage/methylation domain-containing protein n=1 Tax=Ohessyouella blattaphilus TaxID=2949333 RepID=A0ABT1EKE1_9FIRM|nr:prepilin-type N-terminal cleavage/methylation domain-containing protein [Ohessyouella blattaphilus]MCP1110959.1 prepilin-type N-terminal cleavage/methylation domain-containing protein [Ohessyouella blattaphilus]MCR8564353.1 prepilin-type N-terminal cleavage/methylation domain-containing protein [Ohessyouella blattaphilus]